MREEFLLPMMIALCLLAVLACPARCADDSHLPQDVVARVGMVASAHPLASQAGMDVLRRGGNAVDAAVAAALTLNVVEPSASGIGGGAFLLIRAADGTSEVIDARERAPAAATPGLFYQNGQLNKDWVNHGGRSVAVPGAVAGYALATERFGKAEWSTLFEAAIQYAREGFAISEKLAGYISSEQETLCRYPATAAIFLPEGLPMEPGQILRNPDLAATLERLAQEGSQAFYQGEMARAIIGAVTADGGVMAPGDLTAYQVFSRRPVRGSYRGYEILSTPPPSSGGTHLLQILSILENFDVKQLGHNSPPYIHTLAEAMKWAYADREKYMADPDFVEVPVEKIIDKGYAARVAARISAEKAAESVYPGWSEDPSKPGNTSHLCVVDQWGNVVSMTQTINHWFGSKIVVPGYGFLLNDEMADFSFEEGSVNSVQAGKCPLSSMSPSIVLKEGKPVMAVGTPGGTRIITALAQVVMNVLDFGMSMDEAIEAPRFHCSSTGGRAASLDVESRISPATLEALEKLGHKVEVRGAYDVYFGGAHGILISQDGRLIGGADSRRDGVCAGY